MFALVYVRYIEKERMKDELLFSMVLVTTAKAVEVVKAVLDLFDKYELSWTKLMGVCTCAYTHQLYAYVLLHCLVLAQTSCSW